MQIADRLAKVNDFLASKPTIFTPQLKANVNVNQRQSDQQVFQLLTTRID